MNETTAEVEPQAEGSDLDARLIREWEAGLRCGREQGWLESIDYVMGEAVDTFKTKGAEGVATYLRNLAQRMGDEARRTRNAEAPR